jgi:PAS domain S-box-containing protein/putative nucleotidyltransferase with HDIG domain
MNKGTKATEPEVDNGFSSEELYKLLFEQATDGIFIIDAHKGSIVVNPRGREMLGYSRTEIQKKSITDLFPDENMQATFKNQNAIEAGHTNLHEGQLLRKDGSFLPVEVNGQKLKDGRWVGIVCDISERKRAKEEILQLARFPSENPYPVMRVSNQGKILYANEASQSLLEEWNTEVGEMLPSGWKKTTSRLAEKRSSQTVEVPSKERIYSIVITPVPGTDYINLYGSDITEIKRSEKALRQAEEKYRNIFEHSQDGIFQSTPAGRFITVNPALARIWGYESPEEMIENITNIAFQIYVNPEERQEFLRLMDEHREVEDFEYRTYRKDGSIIWVQENVRTVRDVDGNVQYYEGTIKDITKQKQTLESLRRSEERYRRTLNNMLEGCQIIDYDWRYIYVNDTAALHGRRKPEELLMHTMMEIYPGIENTELFRVLQYCMEARTHQRLENEFVFPDGDSGWFELSVEPVPEGLFILSIDITERIQAESDLREREIRYHTLFENLPIPVFTKDRDGRYTSCNAENAKYWAENPVGHTDHELLPPEIADALRAADLGVMETEEPIFGEEKFQSSSGLRYTLARKAPLYDGAGNVIGILGASLDITERKETEKKIKQQLARLTAVNEIDRVITSSFDLGLTLNLLLRHVVRQLDLDAALILLADPNTKMLEYVAGEGFLGSKIKELKLHIGEDYAGKVALERRMIHVPDLSTAESNFSQAYLKVDENFIAYYGLPLIAKGQLKGVLEVFQRAPFEADEDWLSYLETLAEQAAIAIDNAQLFSNLQKTNADLSLAYDATIEGWSYALDLRDKETEGHTERVTELTTKLYKKFGLSEKELKYVRWGALLHDIGKMGVPDSVLQKPDKLSDDEWTIMKMHPVYARNMLERINYLKSAIDIPYCHHEKWDGSGYPRGLKGEQIPLPARIFAVVDVWDALTSDRPYRVAWKRSDALDYIKAAAGTHFDPQVVKLFLESKDLWIDEDE